MKTVFYIIATVVSVSLFHHYNPNFSKVFCAYAGAKVEQTEQYLIEESRKSLKDMDK